MKKRILIIAILVIAMVTLSACSLGNRQIGLDTAQTFDSFKILFGDQVIEGRIKTWRDFDDSDVIQITDTNGNTWLTHYMNVLMKRNKR